MLLSAVVILAVGYFGYQWDQARKLDNYFIDQICLDARVQASKGDTLRNGLIFEEARVEMKKYGYNPCQIQQIVFKGYDKALKKQTSAREAAERLAQNKR